MRMQVDVYHHFPEGIPWGSLYAQLEVFMSALSDKIAELNTHIDSAVARAQAEIDALRKAAEAGGATQADLDAITAAEAKLDAIAAAVNPPAPPVP